MTENRSTNPMFGDQPLKLGLFGYLHDGGNYFTKHPGRWKADWKEIAAMARIADRGGLEYLMPFASWKGWTAEIDHRKNSFETLTQAAAIGAITERICLFSTVHVPFVHPVFAAKALTTIDHVSGGRAGLNIVCGWNPPDYAMFGIELREHDDRYEHGYEWWEILTRILSSGDKEFDYQGRYFQNLKAVSGQPLAIQQPQIAIVSATFSSAGRRYAAKTSDFVLSPSGGDTAPVFAEIREQERAVGRTKDPLKLIGGATIICRETRAEALETVEEYASYIDNNAVDQWIANQTKHATQTAETETFRRQVAGFGGIVGSPEDVAEQLIEIYNKGYYAVGMSLFNYLNDLPLIVDRVLPILEKAGVRKPVSRIAPGTAAKMREELMA